MQILNRINYSDAGTNPVKFREENGEINSLEIHADFVKSIFSQLPKQKTT